jgi:hypothetical protein
MFYFCSIVNTPRGKEIVGKKAKPGTIGKVSAICMNGWKGMEGFGMVRGGSGLLASAHFVTT